eukprot:TRINITY_DN728_c0_g1_i1.p1 TRINITY_DN728_c0_g1~~TRINITY_DN728_c0_g1_i1.p1  ORF type:complete len:118 (-),score=2.02 TRINITY_DN728_c0_g1_i1:17-370(-)
MYTHTVHHSTVQDKTTPHSVIEAIPTLSFTMSTFAYTPQKLSGLIQGVSDSKDGALPVDFQGKALCSPYVSTIHPPMYAHGICHAQPRNIVDVFTQVYIPLSWISGLASPCRISRAP